MERARIFGTFALTLAACIAVSGAVGCMGDDGSGGGDDDAPVDSGDVFAVMEGARAKLAELDAATDEELIRAMHAYLEGTHAFEETGVAEDGSVWGRLVDGELFIVVTNRRGRPTEEDDDIGGTRQELRSALPASTSVYTANTLTGWPFKSAAAEVQGWATGNGYMQMGSGAGVEELENVRDAGIFYIDSHSGMGELDDGTKAFAIWTATDVTPELRRQYEARLRSGELAIMLAPEGSGHDEWHFAITPKFVRNHMSFSADSLVFINSCGSNDASLRAAFVEKHAGVYAGWTMPVDDRDAYRVGRLVLDRLLGRNVADPAASLERRPFPIDAIEMELRELRWNPVTTDTPHPRDVMIAPMSGPPRTITELVFTHTDPNAQVALAPSLLAMTVDESAHTLTLLGYFGGSASRVTLAGQPLTIRSQSMRGVIDEVVADLPASAPFAGPVVVENAGRRSNAKTLVGWTIHVRGRRTLGPVEVVAECDLSFRAGVRGSRVAPSEQTVPALDVDRVDLADRSSCSMSATGEETWNAGAVVHHAVWSSARPGPFGASELEGRSFVYLQLGADGSWSLHLPLQQPAALVRTTDGRAEAQPFSLGITIGDSNGSRFDTTTFDLPPGTATSETGDTRIEWNAASATPAPEHGEGFAYP